MGISRRRFIKKLSLLTGAVTVTSSNLFAKGNFSQKEKLGIALVGLGYYSRSLLAPALQTTRFCELKGIVTGTPSKISFWQEEYSIADQNVYSYDTFDELANNDEIDIVYIVLPTGLHAEYAIKAANAGKHVFCEKPMAMNVEECQAIIDACTKNKVFLSIGYRMQHEKNTQEIIQYSLEKPFGEIKKIQVAAGYRGSFNEGNWRLNADLGGGALYDMGVYPINAARYATGSEPKRVRGTHSTTRPSLFSEVDETTIFEMEMENGSTISGVTSVGQSMNYLRVQCESGWYNLEPFQSYSGVRGKRSDGVNLPASPLNQQATQMDNDALTIKNGTLPLVPGIDGLKDVRIVNAIMESNRNNQNWINV